jgi:predicted nucleic acid-binding protein
VILADTSLLVTNAAASQHEEIAISVVTVGELRVGVLVASDVHLRAQRLARLTQIVEHTTVLPVDREVADAYAALRAKVGGRPTNDLWIAATAIAHRLDLVTRDEQQAKLPGVRARYVAS